MSPLPAPVTILRTSLAPPGDIRHRAPGGTGTRPIGGPRLPYDKSRRLLHRAPRFNRANLVLVLIALVLVGWMAYGAWRLTRVDADMRGLEPGATLTSDAVAGRTITFELPSDRIRTAGLDLDGSTIREDAAAVDGGLAVTLPADIAQGTHTFRLTVDRPVLPPASFTWSFTVDDVVPSLPFPSVLEPALIDAPFALAGRVGAGEQLVVDGVEVPVDVDGSFSLEWDRPPVGPPMVFRVTDEAGNMTEGSVAIPVAYPEVRGVHVRAEDWADPERRAEVLALVDTGAITAVELDLKDENGIVGYTSELPEVAAAGASGDYYDLAEAVQILHDHGAHVTGRLVAFNDPQFASWAWDAGRFEQVVQTPDGEILERGEGSFLSFADPAVRAYISAIAVEAAEAGVDDVLLDYVRRPDGLLDEMVFVGLATTPEQAVVDFLAELQPELRVRGTYLGASVFGIAASAPTDIAQDVPAMANYLDYVAPMLYPSHFSPGNYGVTVPNEDPYTIVARTIADFRDRVEARGIPLVPWLQDFHYDGVVYDAVKVRAQIDAVCDSGVYNHLLWNSKSSYTVDALGSCP